ncbi:hypothetical protein FB567DRAFT_606971 [Paraphoma chrysanthemicola]|uniref:Uncharacterized protein n=1 Tax=Paraphoma chrysanthemicola TaxID=798071 RepID=A0A8K0VW04_9PLEO|nr:hypothetical protein FB567DRAFT_606971 [Paraphoma chrysanthemicola]
MDSPHEREPQAADAQGSSEHALPNQDTHIEHGTASIAQEDSQPRTEEPDPENPNYQLRTEHDTTAASAANVSVIDEAAYERIEQALRASNNTPFPTAPEQGTETAANRELTYSAMQPGVAEDQAQGQGIGNAAEEPNQNHENPPQVGLHAVENASRHDTLQNLGRSGVQVATEAAEALRGNPYMLAASVDAVRKEPDETKHEHMDGDQAAEAGLQQGNAALVAYDAAPHVDAPRDQETFQHAQGPTFEKDATNSGNVLDHTHPMKPDPSHEEQEHEASDQESEGDSVISGDEDMDEDNEDDEDQAEELRLLVQKNAARARSTWAQRGNLLHDDFQFGDQAFQNQSPQAHFNPMVKQEPGLEHSLHQNHADGPSPFQYPAHQNMPFDPMFSGVMHASQQHEQYMPPHQTHAGMPINLGRGGGTIPSFPYQSMVGGGYQHAPFATPHMGMPFAHGPPGTFEIPNHASRPPQSTLGSSMYVRPHMLPHTHNMAPHGRAAPAKQQKQGRKSKKIVDEHDCGEEDESSDDEPLLTRRKRHPSATSDSVLGDSSPPVQSKKPLNNSRREEDSNVEFISSKSKGKKTPTKPTQKAAPQPAPPAQPTRRDSTSSNASINWTLPKYDLQTEPGKTKHDPTVAKISIPNLVREELLLSPDHAEQETHLLVNLFLPAQQALSEPDPEPAVAVLNFHTIAVMVIEAYVQYEIGDEFGTGRGHWHNAHDEGQEEYERLRDARDADPDEIFFAVIDRWRAGLEAGKQPSKLIRGAQEFCDTALDLVYYIKENGLVKERKRAVRADKGVKKGARKVGDGEGDGDGDGGHTVGVGAGKGAKSGKRAAPVNTVEARKKPKVEKAKAKGKAAEKTKRKRKDTGPAITVMKAERK